MFDSAKTWIEPASGTNSYLFDEVHILGSAQLGVMAVGSLKSSVSLHARRVYGDRTGYLHVGYNQNFSVGITEPDIPFNLRVYEQGSVTIPKRAFLQGVSFVSSGKVGCLITTEGYWYISFNSIFNSIFQIISLSFNLVLEL